MLISAGPLFLRPPSDCGNCTPPRVSGHAHNTRGPGAASCWVASQPTVSLPHDAEDVCLNFSSVASRSDATFVRQPHLPSEQHL
ncbi:unnamed protein product [Lampetra planeri]